MGKTQLTLGSKGVNGREEGEPISRGVSMETMSPSTSPMSTQMEDSTFDDFSMHQNLLLTDSLKDLKNLRSQLYSAAEYFELSYTNDDQKQIVADTLKDYTVKAFVNTVDHLGSVSFKVDGLLDEKVDEVSSTELRVSCIEQRLRTCQAYIDKQGLSQQSLVITAPKYHKRYTIPVGASMPESGRQAVAKHEESNPLMDEVESQQFQSAARLTIRNKPPSIRRARSPSPSPRARSSSPLKLRSISPSPRLGKNITADKRPGSPLPTSNPLARSSSVSIRPTLLNSSSMRKRYPSELQNSPSLRLHAERIDHKESEQNTSKSKSFLKSLLTRRRSKNDDMLYSYLDEY